MLPYNRRAIRNVILFCIIGVAVACSGSSGKSGTKNIPKIDDRSTFNEKDGSDLLSELLDHYVPHAFTTEQLQKRIEKQEAEGPPPATADILQLLDYWSYDTYWSFKNDKPKMAQPPEPDFSTLKRMLEECKKQPEKLVFLLGYYEKNAAFHPEIKSIYEQVADSETFDGDDKVEIHKWLMRNTEYYRQDLIEAAKANPWNGKWYGGREDLETLIRLDWDTALPILENHSRGKIHSKALALRLIYEYDTKNDKETPRLKRTRKQLLKIGRTKKNPPPARSEALEAVLEDMPWLLANLDLYIALFKDDTLRRPSVPSSVYTPLCTPVEQNPDKLIPVVAKLIGNKNRAVHNNAAECLSHFNLDRSREDAQRPLLPWLSKPDWAEARYSPHPRLRLAQSMDRVNLPECVPHLEWILKNEKDNFYLEAAQDGLRRHGVVRDNAPQVQELYSEGIWPSRQRPLLEQLMKDNVLSTEDILDAVTAYASKVASMREKQGDDDSGGYHLSPKEQIGLELGAAKYARREAAIAALELAEEKQEEESLFSKSIRAIVAGWPIPETDVKTVKTLRSGSIDLDFVVSLLKRREQIPPETGSLLREVASGQGERAGIASVVLGGKPDVDRILSGNDDDAKKFLIACARMVLMDLPVANVGNLLRSQDKDLAKAAEIYLRQIDTPEAREHLLGKLQAEYPMAGDTSYLFERYEKDLIKRYRSSPDTEEIYAVARSSSHSSGATKQYVISVAKDGTAVFSFGHIGKKTSLRPIASDELAEFRTYIRDNSIDELPAPVTNSYVLGGSVYQYFHMTPKGGIRVYLNSPRIEKDPIYNLILAKFERLAEIGSFSVSHPILESVPGSEMVYAGEVKGYWSKGDDRRILIREPHKPRADYGVQMTWYRLVNGELGSPAPVPELWDEPDKWALVHDSIFQRYQYGNAWQEKGSDFLLVTGNDEDMLFGLWMCKKGKKPKLLLEGTYSGLVLSPDGKWCAASKTDRGWAHPNDVVLINLVKREESKVDIPSAGDFGADVWVESHKKFLLSWYDEETKKLAYYLLDPLTGKTKEITGDFWPLTMLDDQDRKLQPTGRPNEYWAADARGLGKTAFGRYNEKTFTFTKIMEFGFPVFRNEHIWVVESEKKIYIVKDGDLLSIPLPESSQ